MRVDDGPMTSARTSIPTVDVGSGQLAMQSAREVMGGADVAAYSAAPRAFLSPGSSKVSGIALPVVNIRSTPPTPTSSPTRGQARWTTR